MAITVVCSCGKKFQVKDELAGRRGKCAGCGQAITIPKPQAVPTPDLSELGGSDFGSLGGLEGAADPFGGGPLSSADPLMSADPLSSADPLAGGPLAAGPLAAGPMAAPQGGAPKAGAAAPYGGGFNTMGAGGFGKPAAKPAPAASETPWYLKWYTFAGAGGAVLLLVIIVVVVVIAMNSGDGSTPVASAPPKPVTPPAPVTPGPAKPATNPAPGTATPGTTPGTAAPPATSLKLTAAADVAVEPGGATPYLVSIDRAGALGPIQVTLVGLPDKVIAQAVTVPADQSAAQLNISAAPDAAEGATPIRLIVSTGVVQNEQPVNVAVKKVPPPAMLPIAAVTLAPGGGMAVDIKVERNGHQGPIQVAVDGLPEKVTSQPLVIAAEESSGKLQLAAAADVPDAQKAARVLATVGGRTVESPLQLAIERNPFKLLPMPVVWMAPNEKSAVEVKVERRSYQGPIELTVQGLPDNVTAAPVTIPAGQTAAKIELVAAADAKDKVRSARVWASAAGNTSDKLIIVRVKKGEGSLLPDVIVDPELAGLLKRGSFGGRLTAESKQALMDIFGGTKESEAAVLSGLRWLDKHQAADGHWALEGYHQFAQGCDCKIAFEDKIDVNNTAGTALGLLPFLGAGVTPKSSPDTPRELKKYQKTVREAVNYLIKNQNNAKDANAGDLGGGMYAHALGTIALCEAYALTKDKDIEVPAQKAVKYLMGAQSTVTGGWGYGPKQDGDTSVVGWVFLAIRSGQMSGMTIEPRVLAQAGKFLDTTAAGEEPLKKSKYTYRPHGDPTHALTAAGLLSRQYLGWQQDKPEFAEGSKYIMQLLPPEIGDKVGPCYAYYYCTQVLHHLEGKNWDQWNHHMREHLIRTQEKSGHKIGSWSPDGSDWGSRGGRIYSTSLSLLTLEAYYRHLPLYRKIPKLAE